MQRQQVPYGVFQQAGYASARHGDGPYGGVALLSTSGLERVSFGFGGEHGPPFDEPRLVSADVHGIRVSSLYAPNGRTMGSAAWQFKLAWFELLRTEVELEVEATEDLLLIGDFNVCPAPMDVYDPVKKRNRNLVSEPERDALRRLLDAGLADLGRSLHPDEPGFTWFAHSVNQFEKRRGYRLDLALGSTSVASRTSSCRPLLGWREPELGPSDHAPLLVTTDLVE